MNAAHPARLGLTVAATHERLRSAMDDFRVLAIDDDRAAAFPVQGVVRLRELALIGAVLPRRFGGLGLGCDAASVPVLLDILQALGATHLALARLFEGHVNAFALLWTFGTEVQRRGLIDAIHNGELLGVWNAPSRRGLLQLRRDGQGLVLCGEKIYCSGAGAIHRPLVTATTDAGHLLMVWTDARTAQADLSGWHMHGMRATATGTVDFSGVRVADLDVFGGDNDYHRQPAFSAGAWRFAAAQLGAVGELHDLTRQGLLDSGRGQDPHQRARLAEAAVAVEGARLLVAQAAQVAEQTNTDADRAVALAGMARMAVERAAFDVIEFAQRSIGLTALAERCPMERIARDLLTYLRQPVPDAVRDGVAATLLATDGRALERWQ